MRTAKEDIALLGEAGVWDGDRDPLLNGVVLLCMYAKGRHKPVRNLHNLAKAVEKGDSARAQRFYDRLAQEVAATLPKYPDIVGTLETVSELSDQDFERLDRAMREEESDEPLDPNESSGGGLMNFAHAAHEAAYQQVADWIRQMYGESASAWDDSPVFSLPTGVAVAVQELGDDGACVDLWTWPLGGARGLPEQACRRMLSLNAAYRFGSLNLQNDGSVVFEYIVQMEGLTKERLGWLEAVVAGSSREIAETLQAEFDLNTTVN